MSAFAILIVLFCASAAHAVEMPKDLVGNWCITDPSDEKLVKCTYSQMSKQLELQLVYMIGRKVFGTEHRSCEAIGVRKSERVERAWIIKERCRKLINGGTFGDDLGVSTTRYTRRGVYLYVKAQP
jgi:hypothetical protein